MALRLYKFGLFVSLLLSGFLWFLLLLSVNPFLAPFWIIILFYLTMFIVLTSLLAILSFNLKVKAGNKEVIYSHIVPTLRQSAFTSFVIVGLIFLEQLKVLNWWVAGLLIIAMLLVELYYRSRK